MLAGIIALMVAGLVLVGLEMFVPGGVLGILGGICIIAGTVLTYEAFGAMGAVWYGALASVLLVAVILVEFKLLPKTQFGRRLFLTSTSGGRRGAETAGPPGADALAGQRGEALTTLAPTGVVRIGGEQYEAFSEDGLLERGESIEAIGRDNFRVIVRRARG